MAYADSAAGLNYGGFQNVAAYNSINTVKTAIILGGRGYIA